MTCAESGFVWKVDGSCGQLRRLLSVVYHRQRILSTSVLTVCIIKKVLYIIIFSMTPKNDLIYE